jgi:hypothetical protein
LATSGTVGTTRFTTRKMIDNAYGRCKIIREKITAERIEVAKDLLFLRLSAMANKGIPLWCIQKTILPIYLAEYSVPTPVGTVEVLDLNLRRTTRPTGTASSSSGVAANAFDGDFSTACTQVVPNGWIQLQYDSATAIPMFGILPAASGTWDYTIQVSDDGIAFTTIYTATAQAVVAGEWQWFDVEGVTEHAYYRLQAGATTILNVTELVFANTPTEVNLAPLNRDDYSTLPNKFLLSQPTQYWFDRQRTQPIITLWPAVSQQCVFWNLVAYLHRQIQDVGTMAQEIELRQSDYLAVMARLAADLALVDPEVTDPNLIQLIMGEALNEWRDMWDGESDDAPTSLTPNIRPYTS